MSDSGLPDAGGETYRIGLVCLGNICRSPMAEVVLSSQLVAAGLDHVVVDSCGTGDWHVGAPMDRRAAQTLSAAGYDASRHRAQQYSSSWPQSHDLLLAMDRQNLADLRGHLPASSDRVRLFRDFDPEVGASDAADDSVRDVPDPYYGGADGFTSVLEMVERTSAAIVAQLLARRETQERPR